MKKSFALARMSTGDGNSLTTMVIDGVHHDLAALDRRGALPGTGMEALLADWDRAFEVLETLAGTAAAPLPAPERPLSPIPRPGKVLCAAANYAAHVREMGESGFTGPKGATAQTATVTLRPYHFLKASSCSTGPMDDIALPSLEHRIDWEVELGAVIGTPARHVPTAQAMAHVAGYVIVNDVSCRAATWRDDRLNIRSDWLAGKSYDTFLPTGPLFVPAAFVPDYRDLMLRLWVNGEAHQDGPARDMIFSLEEQIEYLSAMLTLESGDLIATGTPAGVGQGKGAYLKPGDLVEAEITGLGRQRNRVRV